MDRRILKPTRRNRDKTNPQRKQEPYEDNFATSTPSSARGSGVKRKCEDWDETPIKRNKCSENLQPYSANERLKRYRQTLEQKKNQVVKVHKVLDDLTEVTGENKDTGITKHSAKANINDRIKKIRTNVKVETKVDNAFKVGEEKSFVDASIITGESLLNLAVDKNKNNQEICFNKTSLHHCDIDVMEDMDWSPINEDELEADIRKLRGTVHPIPDPKFLNLLIENPISTKSTENLLHIIVDTNIFISHLNLIKGLCKENKMKNKLVIYVPWMVFQELDYFKDGRGGAKDVQMASKRAVAFINERLTQKDETLKGQTVHEALCHDFSNSNADDNILFCCLKLQQNQPKIILLSNDKNLRSKVLVHSIGAYSTDTIMSFLNDQPIKSSNQNLTKQEEETPAQKVAKVFTNVCTEIIKTELEKAYGNTVYKIVSEPPWSLQECFMYLKRFWVPVFSLIITQKQCLKAVDNLLEYLKLHKNMGNLSLTEQEEFIKLTLSLCVYFKNCLSPYESTMKSCILEIQKILQ